MCFVTCFSQSTYELILPLVHCMLVVEAMHQHQHYLQVMGSVTMEEWWCEWYRE